MQLLEHTYVSLPTLANGATHNIFGQNIQSVDANLGNILTGFSGTGQARLLRLPSRLHQVVYRILVTISATGVTGSSSSADNVVTLELWNRDNFLRRRSITKSDIVRGSGSVTFEIYTNSTFDLMTVADGGFKVLCINNLGVAMSNLVGKIRVIRG